MSTFIGQLVGFALIVLLLWRYVVPLVRRMMATRQDTIRRQLDESANAKERLAEAEKAHVKAIEQAKSEAKRITEEAKTDAGRITELLKEQADAEVERIKVQGAQHVHLLRGQLIRELRQELGNESVRRAGELVRAHVADSASQSATVDRFLDELDAMAPSPIAVEDRATSRLRSASRESTVALVGKFDALASDLDADALSTIANDLSAAVTLLYREPILTRHLADPSAEPAARVILVERLLGEKVGEPALEVLKAAVSGRWSTDSNLIGAVEHVARLAQLVRAEREGVAADVEEQLFRFGRILESQPRLATLLGEYSTLADRRVALLRDVFDSAKGVNPVTAALISQTVELLHGDHADEAVLDLAELAVARRGEVVAHVGAAADLSDAQSTRLTEVLTRIYGHPVSVQLHTDPQLLGGLTISVGDEVIDGSLASKLANAETNLPD